MAFPVLITLFLLLWGAGPPVECCALMPSSSSLAPPDFCLLGGCPPLPPTLQLSTPGPPLSCPHPPSGVPILIPVPAPGSHPASRASACSFFTSVWEFSQQRSFTSLVSVIRKCFIGFDPIVHGSFLPVFQVICCSAWRSYWVLYVNFIPCIFTEFLD